MKSMIAYKFILGFIGVLLIAVISPYFVKAFKMSELWSSILSIGIAIVSGLIIGYFYSKTFSVDVKGISEAVERISQGELNFNIEERDKIFEDEFNEITKFLIKMKEDLSKLIRGIREGSVSAKDRIKELKEVIREINLTAEEISKAIENMASSVSQEASVAERTLNSMRSLKNSAEVVESSISEAVLLGREAIDLVSMSKKRVDEASETIKENTELILNFEKEYKDYLQALSRITEMSEMITNISEKTNILSLNAAIEAAKAGEYGKGFTVVAEEIRRLAENSSKSAVEIGRVVKEIMAKSEGLFSVLKDATRMGRDGREKMVELLPVFERITRIVSEMGTKLEGILQMSAHQKNMADDVQKMMEELAKAAEENASTAQEISASVEEQYASISKALSHAESVDGIMSEVMEKMERFKI